MHPLIAFKALRVQLPARGHQRIACDVGDARAQVQGAGGLQRLGPALGQAVHGRDGDPMGVAPGRRGLDHAAVFVQHAHRVGAPAAHQVGGGGVQRLGEARIAHREVLRAGVEAAEGRQVRGHAPAGLGRGLEHLHRMPGALQRAGAGQAGHAGADDGELTTRGAV